MNVSCNVLPTGLFDDVDVDVVGYQKKLGTILQLSSEVLRYCFRGITILLFI